MKQPSRVWVLLAAVVVVAGGALMTQWFLGRRAVKVKDEKPAIAAPQGALRDLSVTVLRGEVSAAGLSVLVKVTIQARNNGTTPVRLGPGSFWLMDGEGFPHLDRIAAEKPDAPPLTLEPDRQSQEITMRFEMPALLLSQPLALLVGPAPAGQVRGSKPSPESLNIPVKEAGAPRGPFIDGEWKTYKGTQWK
ncbi:MAG: hypothetical protein HZA91_09740 [Verrucomicrobia bacterium]|nr:hypothetical protein [Verrucomicrobiota bacterium]